MRNRIILIGIVIVAAIGIIVYANVNRGVSKIESMDAELEISSNDLLNAFEENETTANERFTDKVVLVSGKVVNIENDTDQQSIFLQTNNELGNIICQLQDHRENLPAIGEEVKIKGVCTGYLMDVVLNRAMIIE